MEKSARKIWKMKGNQENNFNKNQEQRATLYAYNIFGIMYIYLYVSIWERCTVKHYGLKINNLILENGAAVVCLSLYNT